MHNILALMTGAQAVKEIFAGKTGVKLSGVSGAQKACLLAGLFAMRPCPFVLVLPGREELREYRRDLSVLLPGVKIDEFYPDDFSGIDAHGRSLEITSSRLLLLRRLHEGQSGIILVTAEAFGQFLPAPGELFATGIKLSAGQKADMLEVIKELAGYGYERLDIVDAPGQFCVRGGIVDVFPLSRPQPVRLEWLDDEIDSIRGFSVESQRSIKEMAYIDILPVKNIETGDLKEDLFSYLPGDSLLIIDEARRVKEKLAEVLHAGLASDKFIIWEQLEDKINPKNCVLALSALTTDILPRLAEKRLEIHMLSPYHRQMELLVEDLRKWLSEGIQPVICMGGPAKAAGMAKNLTGYGLDAYFWPEESPRPAGKVLVTVGDLAAGFQIKGENWLLLTENDIFGVLKRKRLPSKHAGHKIRYFSDIKIGDYVVHSVHGIGKYVGSETLNVGGMHRDYLLVIYAGDDKLYIPVDQVQLLHKYIGAEGHAPRLSRMGGADWSRVRGRAKAAITEMAGELLRLQAQRKLLPGHAFSKDTVWQKEFEEAFLFEETADQLKAIEEIKSDMEQTYPMDRLLCGDVGYGKTEVAIRAAFKAVMDGKQAAVLVPTTVLAQQHFLTFSERMQAFGINVDMVSRFRTAKEQKKTLAKTAKGQVDVLIGTHRLLQNDVVFKDIGLLVIDEEQRFGVGQKEKIKRWSSGVDVLVLSATPIPRTLHMGLVSARDMSIIETPPEDRLPVETYVAEYDEQLVQQAIIREIKRGGYVYYVHNRVKDIEKVAENILRLVPEARVKVAHGQMPEELLEAAMMEFYEGQYDVLVCTTIIENGLDVPLANTIIVQGAENFGLSQLYQMRGRVGRSTRLAFSYFLYPRQRVLTEIAEKRLAAIRDFTDLGAGFRIAMRDLEIRGAGNILGPQQHGHILNVGFETYCRLLEETMLELSEQSPGQESLSDTTIEVDVDAYLPDDYIDDAGHKLDVYRRLPFIEDQVAMIDMLDELIDRFGEPPQAVVLLLKLAMLRGMCRRLGIKAVNARALEVKMIFAEQSIIRPEALLDFAGKNAASVRQGPPVNIKVRRKEKTPVLDWLEDVLAVLAG